jgi:hypothetical protein
MSLSLGYDLMPSFRWSSAPELLDAHSLGISHVWLARKSPGREQDVSMQSLDEWHRRPKYPLTGHTAGGHHTVAARSYSSPGLA